MNTSKKPIQKIAENQMRWEVAIEGVTSARLEIHRLHQMINRALKIIELSGKEEQCYEFAGDLIVSVPERVKEIERILDRTGYALSKMGQDELRNRLPASDRTFVEETSKGLSFLPPDDPKTAARVLASQYLELKK